MKAASSVQVNATTGNSETLLLPEPRLVTFKIMGNGPVSAGQITVECCPQNTPIAPGSGSAGAVVWEALNTFAVPPKCHNRLLRRDYMGDDTCADQYAGNRKNCYRHGCPA